MASSFEAAARARKARAIGQVLVDHGATPVTVAALPDHGWAMAATLAGFNPPSPETRRLAAVFVTEAARLAADPFAGLPRGA